MNFPSYLYLFLISTFLNFHEVHSLVENCAPQCDPTIESSARVKGTIAPVFTPFKGGKLNLKIIPQYAKFLARNGIKTIYVFWPDEGSFVLTLCQCKQYLKAWVTACKPLGIAILCEVAGLPFYEVLALAKYATEVGVDAISSLPDLYFKSNLTESLVRGLSAVAKVVYPLPVFYTDKPHQTGVKLNMAKFASMAVDRIDNFGGLLISDLKTALIVQGTKKLTSKQSLFVMRSLYIPSVYGYCLNGTINALNTLIPEMTLTVERAIRQGHYSKGVNCQLRFNEITSALFAILNTDENDALIIPQLTALYRECFIQITKIDVGYPPKDGPVPRATRQQAKRITEILQNANLLD